MRIYCCQLDIAWEDKPANHAKVRRLLDATRPQAGSLVLLPEMFSTGFSMSVATIHDTETREDETFLRNLGKRYGVYVVGGRVTAGGDGRGRNEALASDPDGRELSRYTKLHPFSPGKEAGHYTAGDAVTTFAWHGLLASPFICYDLRFPEAFRRAARLGAGVLCVIANWPAARVDHWVTLLKARAIENQCYVAGVNRCGSDPWLSYPGRSLIIDPRGEILADAGEAEGVIFADVDRDALAAYRREFPVLADMRHDFVPHDFVPPEPR